MVLDDDRLRRSPACPQLGHAVHILRTAWVRLVCGLNHLIIGNMMSGLER